METKYYVSAFLFFLLVNYFIIGILKRDVMIFLGKGVSGRFIFKGVSAVLIGVGFIFFLSFFAYNMLKIYGLNIPRNILVLSYAISAPISYLIYKIIPRYSISSVQISQARVDEKMKSWMIVGSSIAALMAFFTYLGSGSILVTVGIFLVIFVIFWLFGYAFSRARF